MTSVFRRNEFYVGIAIVTLGAVITIVNPSFLTLENLFDLLLSYSALGILSVGVLFVILSGGIDISFTAVAQVAQYVTVALIVKYGGSVPLAFAIACILGIIMGALNGLIVYTLRIPAIIATIATYNIFFGLLYFFSKGHLIIIFPDFFNKFAAIKMFALTSASGGRYGPSLVILIWILVAIISAFVLRFSALGRNVFCIGGNTVAARRVGVSVFRTQMFVYCYMGFLAGIASMVHFSLVLTVIPNSIVGKELEVIAAVVLGGTNIIGGTGTLVGTVLGVLLFAVMSNGLTLMHISSYLYKVITGLIIIISVSISAYQLRSKMQGRRITQSSESAVVAPGRRAAQ